MSVVITSLSSTIKVAFNSTHEDNIPKWGLRVVAKDDYVYLIPESESMDNLGSKGIIKLLYSDVSTPSSASAIALKDTIIGYVDTYCDLFKT